MGEIRSLSGTEPSFGMGLTPPPPPFLEIFQKRLFCFWNLPLENIIFMAINKTLEHIEECYTFLFARTVFSLIGVINKQTLHDITSQFFLNKILNSDGSM